MRVVYEPDTMKYRGEEFKYVYISFQDDESGERFTTTESDTIWYNQVTNQYRAKYGIPYTDEIIAVRQRYGVSAAKMSQILGIGINQYRRYEQGEVPSVSNGRMIRSVMNPKVMLEMVESSKHELSEGDYEKLVKKVKAVIGDSEARKMEEYEKRRVFSMERGVENGFAILSLERLKNVMLYVLNRCDEVWTTKMNKLLFYVDFVSYRERGMALTGLTYRAIEYGPVPERWDRVYSEFAEVKQELRQAGEFVGSVLRADCDADVSVFSEDELRVLDEVVRRFEKSSSREISGVSHEETAWQTHYEGHERIPFVDAFELKGV